MTMRLALQIAHDAASVGLVRQLLERALAHEGVDDDLRGDLRLAVDEACANVITHTGPGGEFEVRVSIDGQQCVVEIADCGPGVDLGQLPDRVLLDAESGRGLHIIRSVTDALELRPRNPHGLTVRLVKHL